MRDIMTLQQHYVRCFEDEAGQVVLNDLEARAFVRGTSFTPEPQRAAFNEGRRSLVLHIRRMLEGQGFAEGGQHTARGGGQGTEP